MLCATIISISIQFVNLYQNVVRSFLKISGVLAYACGLDIH